MSSDHGQVDERPYPDETTQLLFRSSVNDGKILGLTATVNQVQGSTFESGADERQQTGSERDTLLLRDVLTEPHDKPNTTQPSVYATVAVLLIGVFISQTDTSLMLATYGNIASTFGDLELGSWLISSYILAQCVAQPLYGSLSNIYGRKSCLQASYVIFAAGTLSIGVSRSMGQLISARAVQGVGGAGMLSMVSIIITDLVPIQEVASLRSYVNILQTLGRGCGGVIGGFLTQTLGWRWAFLIQLPPIVLAIVLVQWRLHLVPNESEPRSTKWEKLKRVDFLGAACLCATILSICLILDAGGQSVKWTSPTIKILAAVSITSGVAFVVNSHYVREPIFPLRLLGKYAVMTNYLIALLATMAQLAIMLVVPPFFEATKRASATAAGAYLIPAFLGNCIGGVATGLWIRRTGVYKAPIVFAPFVAVLGYMLCYTLWSEDTSNWAALATLPGGFATAVAGSATFVALAAGVVDADLAVAASGMYLANNVGAIAGTSAGSAAFQMTLQAGLRTAVEGREDGARVYQPTYKKLLSRDT